MFIGMLDIGNSTMEKMLSSDAITQITDIYRATVATHHVLHTRTRVTQQMKSHILKCSGSQWEGATGDKLPLF